jgi:8-oxo-dGTP pyrophosphatase MutT (NUDIX family)
VEWTDQWLRNEVIEPSELHPYLADLDMLVYGPNDSNAIFSEELNGLSSRDNLEKCDILLTAAGDYNVVIVNDSNNGESADYGFAFELHPLLTGDFQPDYVVDYTDVEVLALEWLGDADYVDAELYPDGIINFLDLAVFGERWLQTDPAYYQNP